MLRENGNQENDELPKKDDKMKDVIKMYIYSV